MSVGYGKLDAGFRVHKRSLEPTTMALGVDRTPVDRFFVCNVHDAVDVDPAAWTLTIGGGAAAEPVTLTLADLQAMPQHDVEAWLECAGNGRRLFEFVDGHVPSKLEADTQWTLGAMGMASWRGPRLADVLALAGLADEEWKTLEDRVHSELERARDFITL